MHAFSEYKHFYSRAAFGLYPDLQLKEKSDFRKLLRQSGYVDPINVMPTPPVNEMMMRRDLKGDPEKLKMYRQQMQESYLQLNTSWITRMLDSSLMLREKMVFFWHDHFACNIRSAFLAQQHNNTLRTHAVGKFSDLLMAVSKDAAMLQFLNNQQNRKDSPNENFAREVMELFTLGRGNYSEDDIKQAARAFTGWAFDPTTGAFVFRKGAHDNGIKTFRGKQGNFSGEDIIAAILEDRATATFITEKIWRFFVHPEIMDKGLVQNLAEDFFTSGYDIPSLLANIFDAGWCYDQKYVGNRVKSPVELIVGIMTQTGGRFDDEANVLFIQRALGQVLFQPPNVGGWPMDKEWIDSSSLAFRMSLPAILLRNSETEIEPKDDGDVNNIANGVGRRRKVSLTTDWQKLSQRFVKERKEETLSDIGEFLLAKLPSSANLKLVSKTADESEDDPDFVKKAFTAFMSLPEYQLC